MTGYYEHGGSCGCQSPLRAQKLAVVGNRARISDGLVVMSYEGEIESILAGGASSRDRHLVLYTDTTDLVLTYFPLFWAQCSFA